MKNEPNDMPNAVVSFDALLALALQEQTRRELAALPDAETLQILYPDTAGWDKRLRCALNERRKAERKSARSAPPAPVRRLTLRRLITVAAVLVLVLAGALATSAEVRYAVRHAVLQWTDIDLRLTYDTEGTPAPDDLTLPQGYADHYVPEGFVLDEGNALVTQTTLLRGYENAVQGQSYYIACYAIQPEGQVSTFDDEHTTYETIDLNGREATLGTSMNYDGSTSYYLFWESNGIHQSVSGNVPLNELLKIAQNIY